MQALYQLFLVGTACIARPAIEFQNNSRAILFLWHFLHLHPLEDEIADCKNRDDRDDTDDDTHTGTVIISHNIERE